MTFAQLRSSSAILAAAALTACSAGRLDLPTTPDPTALFQTDSLSYTLSRGAIGYQGDVGVTFTNRTSTAARIGNCLGSTPVALEELVDGQWQVAWSAYTLMCASPMIVVQPGGTWRTSIGIFGAYPESNAGPRFARAQVTGTYRAVYQSISPSVSAGYVSNPFMLVAPPR